MSYSYSFVSNNVYGAESINEITKRLVTNGVEDMFEDGVPYNFSHVNTISKNISAMGVIPENNTSLKVIDNGKTGDEYTLTISEGTAFFDDGSTITVYDGGEILPYIRGQKNYVYLHRDLNLNKNMPKVTTSAPEGDFVPLAEISEDGTVTDTRIFAKGKLPGYMSDYNNAKKIETHIENGECIVDLGGNNYKLITICAFARAGGREGNNFISSTLIADKKLVYNMSVNGSRAGESTDINQIYIEYFHDGNPASICAGISFDENLMKIKYCDFSMHNPEYYQYDIDIYVA